MVVARRLVSVGVLAIAFLVAASTPRLAGSARLELPSRLTDQEFWRLSEEMSEPNGTFFTDNLTSNERVFARLVPALAAAVKPGGVYLGVGPEQNFTYIAAMKPRMAFITDIRRGNLHMHLMYKALFELSADRADFLSRLFTKKRPANVTAASTVTELMDAYWHVFTQDEAAYEANLQAIIDHLTKTRRLPLNWTDFEGIGRVYRTFYWYGLSISYSANVTLRATSGTPNYRDLMIQSDYTGEGFSYLGSEEKFAFVKDLQGRNMLVPVVGNFAGPKALRAVGAYVRARGATVSAFYLSNVETYLGRDGIWPAFCANVASMPLDETSVFIRPSASMGIVATRVNGVLVAGGPSGSSRSGLVPMADEVKGCG